MEISERIDRIIDQRKGRGQYEGKGHIQEITRKIDFCKKIKGILESYTDFRNKVLSQIADRKGEYYELSLEDPTFEQKVESASAEEALKKVAEAMKALSELHIRFDRETINISVVGRAGQGKSRLLQSISGVDNAIIPADSGGDCTGAKSVICNAAGKLHAVIHFYTPIELLEQVQKYLDALGFERTLGSVSQIEHIDLGRFNEEKLTNRQQSYFERLSMYVEHYEEYIDFLNTTKDVDKPDDIRKYVAQYLLDGTKVYNFLAVKEVKIFTPFNYADAGKIMLVDTIGLGDTAIGLREKMIDTMVNDSDAAIMLRRPDKERDGIRDEDNELYDLINERMKGRDLEKWLFYVLNIYGDNAKTGKNLYEQLMRKFGKSLKAAFIKCIDCADQTAVEKDLIVPMLELLSKNLSEVDNCLIVSANMVLEKCHEEFYALSSKIKALADSNFKKDLSAGGLFDTLYEDELQLARKLEELNRLYKDHDRKCVEIEDEVKKTILHVANECPEYDNILSELKSGKSEAHPSSVYERLCDHFRAALSDKFDELNRTTIVHLQEGIKRDIIEVLRSEEGGHLNAVPLNTDSDNPDSMEWMEAFINERLDDFPLVKEAFENILNYRLNIEGMLEYYVNTSLECMDPEEKGKFANLDFSLAESKEEEAVMIEQSLLSASRTACNSLIEMIQGLLKIPYNSFYARIRKLREKIIYSKVGERELKNMYREFATYIWKERFASIATKQVTLQELDSIIDSFAQNRAKNLFVVKFNKE